MDILQFIQGKGREKESRKGERRSQEREREGVKKGREKESRKGERRSQEREREGVKFTRGTQISTSLIHSPP